MLKFNFKFQYFVTSFIKAKQRNSEVKKQQNLTNTQLLSSSQL